jgi:hypothetical protein
MDAGTSPYEEYGESMAASDLRKYREKGRIPGPAR